MQDISRNKFVAIVLLVAALSGAAYWLDNVKDEAEVQVAAVDLTRMTMAQAIVHCRAIWTAGHYDQAPLAMAWYGNGVDWYVLEGMDEKSMRHFSCDGTVVHKGARYERIMARYIPAAPAADAPAMQNLFTWYAQLPDPAARALEAAVHPGTQQLLERRWRPSGAMQSTWPDFDEFPMLFRTTPPEPAFASQPQLKPLRNLHNWIKHPDEVFALLATQMPPGTRIAELSFDDKSIRLRIAAPTPNPERSEPSPFGDASFDEYGVRDADWWYPRDQTGTSCSPGHRLQEIAALFAEGPNAKNPRLWSASFSCRGAGKLADSGGWDLRVTRR